MKPDPARVESDLKKLEDQIRRLRDELHWLDDNTSIERRRRIMATAAFAAMSACRLYNYATDCIEWLKQPPEDPPF